MRRVDDHIIPSLVVCAVEFDKEHVKYIVDRIPNRDELPPPPLALLVGLSPSLAKASRFVTWFHAFYQDMMPFCLPLCQLLCRLLWRFLSRDDAAWSVVLSVACRLH
jgi:hypothetical protein